MRLLGFQPASFATLRVGLKIMEAVRSYRILINAS